MHMFDPLGDVKAACDASHLRLIAGRWGDGLHCGCPMTLYAASKGCPIGRHPKSWLCDQCHFQEPRLLGFTCGFDLEEDSGLDPSAYALGSLMRKALLP